MQLFKLKPKPNLTPCLVIYPELGIKIKYIENPLGKPYKYKGKLTHLLICPNGASALQGYEPLSEPATRDPRQIGRARKLTATLALWRYQKQLIETIAVWALIAAVGIGGFLVIILLGELQKGG